MRYCPTTAIELHVGTRVDRALAATSPDPKINRQQQSLNEGQIVSNAYLDPKGQTGVVLYTIKREYKERAGTSGSAMKLRALTTRSCGISFPNTA